MKIWEIARSLFGFAVVLAFDLASLRS